MKEKIKKFLNSKLFIFIITAIVFSTIGVSASTLFPSNDVTYDNSVSGLNSNNFQAAIDELYKMCKVPEVGGDGVLDNTNIVTSGDGLYKDEYETGKYTYKGANPNNYITFNGESAGWRIISINADKTIKIIKSESIGNRAWDTSNKYGSNNWARPAEINTYLNETYYPLLNTTSKNQIIVSNYYIGGVTEANNNMSEQINDEKSQTWYGRVALTRMSEYIRASANASCNTHSKYENNYNTCKNSNWMYNSDISWWMLTPRVDTDNGVYVSISNGSVGIWAGGSTDTYTHTRPVVTLSSSVQIIKGDAQKIIHIS